MFDPADTGKFVKAAVLNRERLLGKRLLGATAYYTAGEILEEFKELFPEAGKDAFYNEVAPETFKQGLLARGMPEFAAEELLENFLLLPQFGYYGGESLDETYKFVEDKVTTWTDLMKKSPVFKDLK
jgi:hypothetical protein